MDQDTEKREIFRDGVLLALIIAFATAFIGYHIWWFYWITIITVENHYLGNILPENLDAMPMMFVLFIAVLSVYLVITTLSKVMRVLGILSFLVSFPVFLWMFFPLPDSDIHTTFYQLYDYPSPDGEQRVTLYQDTQREPGAEYHFYVVVLHPKYPGTAKTLYVADKFSTCGDPFQKFEKFIRFGKYENSEALWQEGPHPIKWLNNEELQIDKYVISIYDNQTTCRLAAKKSR